MQIWKSGLFGAAAIAIVGASSVAHAQSLDARASYDIPSQPIGEALILFSHQSSIQVVTASAPLDSIRSARVRGTMTARQALERLLGGSGLTWRVVGDDSIAIITQAGQSSSSGARQGGPTEESNPELVVTGTRIRGARPASPVIVIDEGDFERAGHASVREVVQSLPQNSGSGYGEVTGVVSPTPEGRGAGKFVSTGNLRGLGSVATQVLINGRRLVPTGISAAADISAIPISAVDRVEVLTDGATAIYGSDAVAGVINFVLKDDLQGAETSIQLGSATQADLIEARVSQSLGTGWGSGQVFGVYEYYQRDPLRVEDRAFLSGVPRPYYLTADQKRHSIFVHADQRLAPGIKVFVDGLYSEQDKTSLEGPPVSIRLNSIEETLSLSAGTVVGLPFDWSMELIGLYGETDNSSTASVRSAPPTDSGGTFTSSESLEAKLDGPIFGWAGGLVRGVVGGGLRKEKLENRGSQGFGPVDRSARYLFGELAIPLVGTDNAGPGLREFQISLAARYEDYSDVGSSVDPKVGVLWMPMDGLKVRGTWGTSFRVPRLYELEGPSAAFIINLPDPTSPTGTTLSIISAGSNSELQPETSTTWTTGLDITPPTVPNLSLSFTYFNIKYKGKIEDLQASVLLILRDERFYPEFINRDPDDEFLRGVVENAQLVLNLAGNFDYANVGAFARTPVNVATYKTSGIDMLLGYRFDIPSGEIGLSLNSSFLFEADQQVSPLAGPIDRLDKLFYVTSLRSRGGVTWSKPDLSASLFVNHVNGYDNNTVTPTEDIDSYTTTDVNFSYHPANWRGLLGGTRLSFTVRNIFDVDPPFVRSSAFARRHPFNFDPSNADPIGRFVTFQLTKRW